MTIDELSFKELIGDRDRYYTARDGLTARGRRKLDERLVLERVYHDREAYEVAWRERPDFALSVRNQKRKFGVEVCRYYETQSAARLREIPTYTGHLLGGGSVLHKDDISGLQVAKIEIQTADGQTIAVDEPAIFQEKRPLAAVVDGIRGSIIEKSGLFSVEDELSHINLIVEERTDSFAGIAPSDFYRHFGTPNNVEAVFQSQFREIYVITRLNSGLMYVPLKLLFSLATLYFFHKAVVETLRDADIEMYEYMALFAGHLRKIASGPVGIRKERDTGEVLYGDTGFIVAQDGSELQTTIRTYRDSAWPPDAQVSFSPSLLTPQIHSRAMEIAVENRFESSIAFPAFTFEVAAT